MSASENLTSEAIDFIKGFLTKKLTTVQSLTREIIMAEAQKYASASPVPLNKDHINDIVKYVESRLVYTMGEGDSLIDEASEHDEDWYQKREVSWSYWNDYKELLLNNGWQPRVVHTMGVVTDKIIGLLKDPADNSEYDRRGLVIGHVQSGKTANYIGVVTKAADAGYKFIVVIAGIHNNLRKQTQQRIDEGFVGTDSTPSSRDKPVGVGNNNRNRKSPVALTNTASDFTKQFADNLSAHLEVFNRPVVVVIKKNVTTLKNLYSWLKGRSTRGGGRIADIPMLMIDDEADNASINTNKDDINPTKTNQEIRKILKLFKKHSYVGYTATPFANIFINPDSSNDMLHDDLFPRDFIYCLDAPTNYFGPDRVFLDEEKSEKVLETIEDSEPYIPLNHKTKDLHVEDVPPSMLEAVRMFVVARAIRNLRGDKQKHCTMLINVSRFVNVQKQVKEIISFYLEKLKPEVRYNCLLPVETALKNQSMQNLKAAYDMHYSDSNTTWAEVQNELADAIDPIKTFVVNSKSDEVLDYKKAADAGESLTAIAIGGLSLSRGLTLEGLTISYMYRNTKMYDTLMQMGRWFGYRPNYDDLCRVWLSEDSQGWYAHIAEATEELRTRVKQMRRDGLKPSDFGLYVRSHPDVLIVTAMNKMRSAKNTTLEISLSGHQKETHIVPENDDITMKNLEAIRNFYLKLNSDFVNNKQVIDNTIFWQDVGWEFIHDFIYNFRFHRALQQDKSAVMEFLKKISTKYPKIDVAFISLKKDKPELLRFMLDNDVYMLCQDRTIASKADPDGGARVLPKQVPDSEAGYYVTSKQRVASRGSEVIGLSQEQVDAAKIRAAEDGDNIADKHYRFVRGKPLLMIHVLNLMFKSGKDAKPEMLASQVPAISVSFPEGGSKDTVTYVVNKVWLKQQMESFDNPDDEDDFDE